MKKKEFQEKIKKGEPIWVDGQEDSQEQEEKEEKKTERFIVSTSQPRSTRESKKGILTTRDLPSDLEDIKAREKRASIIDERKKAKEGNENE